MATFKEVLRANLGAKLLAFLVAAIVWASVSLEPRVEAAVEAGVRYKNVSSGLELNPDQADRVTLIVAGPRIRMRQLTEDGLAKNLIRQAFFQAVQRGLIPIRDTKSNKLPERMKNTFIEWLEQEPGRVRT